MPLSKEELEAIGSVIAAATEPQIAPFAQQVATGFRDLNQRLTPVERTLTGVAQATEAGFPTVLGRLDSLQARLESLEARVAQLEERVSDMDERLARLTRDITRDITRGRTSDSERIAALEARVAELEARLAGKH